MSNTALVEAYNDDIVGYLFSQCIEHLSVRETPSDDEIEAANLELENAGVMICKAN